MKKFWKALGIAALAAAVPVRYKKDEETGVKTFQSLLWKLDITPKEDDTKEIGLDLMEGVITGPLMDLIDARKEAELFTDDPEEAVPFTEEIQAAADEVQAVADEAEAAVEEAAAEVQAVAEEIEAAADEAQAADGEAQAAADETQAAAGEDDYDPYFF